ncbi:MAG TPA: TPM domain-containing protein [Candidatus Coprenecus pullistercoris]|nr:TPM domain-containing protein [Candidatus Coprenecus pullistercoris]
MIRTIIRCLSVLCAALAVSVGTAAAQIPEKPSVPRAVNDFAGIFSRSDAEYMNRALVDFADSTSNRIVVVTVNDLGGMDPAMFAYEIGERWGVGSEKFDNGIVVLVKPKTSSSSGQVYIAVGYGLEGAIPDAIAKRIVENEMIPRFRENDYTGGVAAALNVLMRLSAGEISYKEYEESVSDGAGGFIALGFIILFIIVLVIARRNGPTNIGHGGSSVADAIFWSSILGGGRSHGGGFSGGGFSGGFGGGSFGGGGAGGSW